MKKDDLQVSLSFFHKLEIKVIRMFCDINNSKITFKF